MRLVLIFCFFSLSHLDGESNLGPKTFEELCRAHIEAFAKGAQEYALSTQLTDRVNLWQERLAPILEEEERRAEFDIHAYASRVIQLAQEELVRKDRLATLGQLAGGVAHEIRNPLAVIRNNVYYFEATQKDDEQAQTTQETKKESNEEQEVNVDKPGHSCSRANQLPCLFSVVCWRGTRLGV